MLNFFKWLLLTLGAMAVWLVVNIVSTQQGWFTQTIAPKGNSSVFMSQMVEIIKEQSKGNAVLLLIEDGKIYDQYASSKDEPVNKDSVFGVASVGKWVSAVGIMTLVEAGKLNLDAPVSSYLTRWQLPNSAFNNDEVTIRRLLSHTAGITDGLGHNGFSTKAAVQPLTEHLTQALDIDEGTNGQVKVGIKPGSSFKYSGGSYNLLQLVIEEVSGMNFSTYMKAAVFEPLGMNNTGYRHDNINALAQYFDDQGNVRSYPYYTSLAATGLYTTASDLLKFMSLHIDSNASSVSKVLSQESLATMRTPHASTMGIDIWGLGAMLFASNNNGDYIIGHGGQSPALNATVRVNPATGNGIIMLTTGNKALAADSATRWTLWETGNPDIYMLKNMIPDMLKRVAMGCVIIVILSLVAVWRRKRTTQ